MPPQRGAGARRSTGPRPTAGRCRSSTRCRRRRPASSRTRWPCCSSAIAHHARVDVVNIMTFDYYDGDDHGHGLGARSARPAACAHQLHRALPGEDARAELWAMEGNTILPGIDDYPAADRGDDAARRPPAEASSPDRVGLGELSIWAIQRDNGGCPGELDANECSGIVQPRVGVQPHPRGINPWSNAPLGTVAGAMIRRVVRRHRLRVVGTLAGRRRAAVRTARLQLPTRPRSCSCSTRNCSRSR